MVFKLALTFPTPQAGAGPQQGFPAPGSGAQRSGKGGSARPAPTPWTPTHPTKGRRSWGRPSAPQSAQRGFPSPQDPAQRRPVGTMPNAPPIFGGVYQNYTEYFSRGAAAYVPNFGKVLTNPIGAGVVALHRPQASYGGAGQYADGAIWWTSQAIPTSINPQSLTDPQELEAILGSLYVQGVVRTTG